MKRERVAKHLIGRLLGCEAAASEFDMEDMGALMDMGDYDDMGAPIAARRPGGRLLRIPQTGRGAIRGRPPIVSAMPGVPTPTQARQPLGLTNVVFTAASAQLLAMTGLPQRPFRGRRLVLNVLRTAGAAAIGVNVVAIMTGQTNEMAGQQPTFAEAFGPLATDMVMQMQPAGPGITISVQCATTAAPAGADTVTVQGQILGDVVA
jgi:hypothetical protein